MPRQNRVSPLGDFIITKARGAYMGNRGILHNREGQLGRARWKHPNWVTCVLESGDTQRQLMAPGKYTELFFLDEATAFAAGHRPCGQCRPVAYQCFKSMWLSRNGHLLGGSEQISFIDKALHHERVDRTRKQKHWMAQIENLPDGVFVLLAGSDVPRLIWQEKVVEWTPGGYRVSKPVSNVAVEVITPKSITKTFAAGYVPQVDPTVDLITC